MLASFPASMLNQKRPDLGIPNRFKLEPSRSSVTLRSRHEKRPQPTLRPLSILGRYPSLPASPMMVTIDATVSRTTIIRVCRTDNTTIPWTVIGRGVVAAVGHRGITIVVIPVTGVTAIVAVPRSVTVSTGSQTTDHRCPDQSAGEARTPATAAPVRFRL